MTGVPERKQKGLVMSRRPLQVCCEGMKEGIEDRRAQKRQLNMLSAPNAFRDLQLWSSKILNCDRADEAGGEAQG